MSNFVEIRRVGAILIDNRQADGWTEGHQEDMRMPLKMKYETKNRNKNQWDEAMLGTREKVRGITSAYKWFSNR